MSYGIFVTVPGVPGVTTVKEQKDKIEAHSFQYGVVQPHDKGISAGERIHSSITISKYSDKASALLMLACVKGTRYDTVKFEFVKVDRGTANNTFGVITIKNAIVESWNVGGVSKGASAELDETVAFAFQEIDVTMYGSQASDVFRVNPQNIS